jgi:hypothetical protein
MADEWWSKQQQADQRVEDPLHPALGERVVCCRRLITTAAFISRRSHLVMDECTARIAQQKTKEPERPHR